MADVPPSSDVVAYSEPHTQSSGLVRFSPTGTHVASVAGYRLILRDVDTLQIVQLYACIDRIEGLEWSCDGQYVLCSVPKRGAAQVWSLHNKEWHCKIDEGPVGLAHARFAPDGRHVLATADFRLRITIWSLCDRSVFYIRFPKHVRAAAAAVAVVAACRRHSSPRDQSLDSPDSPATLAARLTRRRFFSPAAVRGRWARGSTLRPTARRSRSPSGRTARTASASSPRTAGSLFAPFASPRRIWTTSSGARAARCAAPAEPAAARARRACACLAAAAREAARA